MNITTTLSNNQKGMIVIQRFGQEIDVFRTTLKSLLRNLGALDEKKAFCCDCTYTQGHTITEVAACGSISLNELAGRLNMDKSFMSKNVDDLVKKGYLKREQDPSDRRYVIIRLTEKGEQLQTQIERQSRNKFAELLAGIQQEERQMVIKGLEVLNRALKNMQS